MEARLETVPPSFVDDMRNLEHSFVKRFLFLFPILLLLLSFAVSMGDGGILSYRPSQEDALLYCQSARQFAQGTPFVFTPLGEVSTGNTTYLYPILLVPFYLFWGTGNGIFLYGFLLNAIFYLAFIWAWFLILGKLISDAWTRIVAMLLLVTFGQAMAVATGQTDTGLFMAVTATMFAALLHRRMVLFGFLLALSPWCRPEGTILSVLYLGFLVGTLILEKRPIRRKEFVIACAAIASALSVFAVNYALTGQFQYQSVSEKGHFKNFDFIFACFSTFQDLLTMVRGLFLGLEQESPRDGFLLPLFGGLLFVCGLLKYPWREDSENRWKLLWWMCSGVATIGLVASSGWQGTNIDRYEGWILPLVPCFMAVGVHGLSVLSKTAKLAISVVLIGFQICAAVFVFLPVVRANSRLFQQRYEQYEELAESMPPDVSIGSSGLLSYAFCHQERYPEAKFVVHNFQGIYSPSFLNRDILSNIERLKHKTVPRFDIWTFPTSERSVIPGLDVSALCGERIAQTFGGYQSVWADWTSLDNASRLPFDTNQWDLVDSIDVGHADDETGHNYEIFQRYSDYRLKAFGAALTNQTDHLVIYDVGKPVIGWDKMDVHAIPSVPLRIYLRTSSSAHFSFSHASAQVGVKDFSVDSPSKFQLFVNGNDMGFMEKTIDDLPGVAQVIYFDVPGEAISGDKTTVEIVGDHIAYQYWFAIPKRQE